MKSGIVIGSGRLVTLSDRQLRDVLRWIKEAYPDVTAEECTNIAKRFSRILINNDIEVGTVYRIGDTIAIRDSLSPHTEWVMELKDIYMDPSVIRISLLWMENSTPPRQSEVALPFSTTQNSPSLSNGHMLTCVFKNRT